MPTRSIALAVLLFALVCAPVGAVAPQGTAFSYQGVLRQDGAPVNGSADLVLQLFDAAIGGTQIGPSLSFTAANGNPVTVVNGEFELALDFGPAAFNGPTSDQRFLYISVNGVPLAPRTPIQSAPYALQSRTTELAYAVSAGAIGAGQIDASVVQRRVSGFCTPGSSIRSVASDGSVTCQPDANSGTITGVVAGNGLSGGGTSGAVSLAVAAPLTLSGSPPDAFSSTFTAVAGGSGNGGMAVRANSFQPNGIAVYGDAIGAGRSGVEGHADTGSTFAVFGLNSAASGSAIGVRGQSDSPTGIAVGGYVGNSTSSNRGVLGRSSAPTGIGVEGGAMDATGSAYGAGTGVRGQSASGAGVQGVSATGTGVRGDATGAGSGVAGYAAAAGGFGVFGQNSQGAGVVGSTTTNGIGVWGRGDSTTVIGGGPGVGVYGQSNTGYGVQGRSNASDGVIGVSTGAGVGVRGSSVSGAGVLGSGPQGVRGETASTTGFAVAGVNNGGGTGISWGIYGQNTSTGGYAIEGYNPNGIGVRGNGSPAGQFIGNVQVVGTLSKSAGSFQIDHPLDPAHKYLYHSFVESPDMKNLYDGTATLDSRGEAWVEMPAYFEALNREFRYQLTALGGPAPGLYVADEIAGNRFRIAGGIAGQRVSWQVTGTRHDAYAEAHRIPVEVDKDAKERGKYLYPALYGKSAGQAIHPVLDLLPATAAAMDAPAPGGPP